MLSTNTQSISSLRSQTRFFAGEEEQDLRASYLWNERPRPTAGLGAELDSDALDRVRKEGEVST
jgi:hypothetical protein